jgi:hypothetical protein
VSVAQRKRNSIYDTNRAKCHHQGRINRWSHRYSGWCWCCPRREQKIPFFPSAHRPIPSFPRRLDRNIYWYVFACSRINEIEANRAALQPSSPPTEPPQHTTLNTHLKRSKQQSVKRSARPSMNLTAPFTSAPKNGPPRTDTHSSSASGSPPWPAHGTWSIATHI